MKQIPLYEQIYEEIREKIEERGYRVGDRLPSEKELSEQYHVSRITSKKAVELLAEEGLVTRIPGKGTFVIEHQEMPKALEIPADSMTEKKPLPDHPPVIGVVLDGFGADFGCQMLGSIEMECRNQGFGMMFVCSYGRKDEETTGIERLRELGVSGIIIMCVHDENYSESQKPKFVITGIAGKRGFCSVNIEKDMMNSEIGFGRRILQAFEDNGISFEHVPSGIDTMTVFVHQDEFMDKEQNVVAAIHRLAKPDMIDIEGDLALIAVVGRGMRSTRGTAGRIFSALAHANINVKMIDQGSSELNIIIGVSDGDFENAIRAIYNMFVLVQL